MLYIEIYTHVNIDQVLRVQSAVNIPLSYIQAMNMQSNMTYNNKLDILCDSFDSLEAFSQNYIICSERTSLDINIYDNLSKLKHLIPGLLTESERNAYLTKSKQPIAILPEKEAKEKYIPILHRIALDTIDATPSFQPTPTKHTTTTTTSSSSSLQKVEKDSTTATTTLIESPYSLIYLLMKLKHKAQVMIRRHPL